MFELLEQGLPHAEISRRTGVNRATIRAWTATGMGPLLESRRSGHDECRSRLLARRPAYAYLLGQYLGDGCLSPMRRGVHRLRITCADSYPEVMDECCLAMRLVVPNTVGALPRIGCTELYSDWKHWPCAFPQAGRGPKHLRPIELTPWQEEIAIEQHPDRLLRGLIHSDGCRCVNRVKRKKPGAPRYEYLRYFFSNRSEDILGIFTRACDQVGVRWRRDGPWNISVARRESVWLLDEFVGPKS